MTTKAERKEIARGIDAFFKKLGSKRKTNMNDTNPQQSPTATKSRLLETVWVALIVISSVATLLIAASQVKVYSSTYCPGLSPYILLCPLILCTAFLIFYFTRDNSRQSSLKIYCIVTAVCLFLVLLICDYYNSEEQAKWAGNTRLYQNRESVDSVKVVSYGPFTRTFALCFNGQVTKTVVVKRTFGKFKAALPFSSDNSPYYQPEFSFNALNIFAWELQ
jgi:hypothetical protein